MSVTKKYLLIFMTALILLSLTFSLRLSKTSFTESYKKFSEMITNINVSKTFGIFAEIIDEYEVYNGYFDGDEVFTTKWKYENNHVEFMTGAGIRGKAVSEVFNKETVGYEIATLLLEFDENGVFVSCKGRYKVTILGIIKITRIKIAQFNFITEAFYDHENDTLIYKVKHTDGKIIEYRQKALLDYYVPPFDYEDQ